MQFLSQVSYGIQRCFTPDMKNKPTKEDNYRACGIIVAAIALRAIGFLDNRQTLFVSVVSSTYLLSNVTPIPLFTQVPVAVGLTAIAVAVYCVGKAAISTFTWLTRPYTLSELNDKLSYIDKNPNTWGGFSTYTRASDLVRDIVKANIPLTAEQQVIFDQIQKTLASLKTLEPSLHERETELLLILLFMRSR